MKILIIIIVLLSLISCGRHRPIKNKNSQSVKTTKNQDADNAKTSVKMITAVRKKVNVFQKIDINIINLQKNQKNKKPRSTICHYFGNGECHTFFKNQIITLWLNRIDNYKTLEQANNDLHFIATTKKVASFLKNNDTENHVVKKLLVSSATFSRCSHNKINNVASGGGGSIVSVDDAETGANIVSVDDAETGGNIVSVDDAETGANVVSGDVAETGANVVSGDVAETVDKSVESGGGSIVSVDNAKTDANVVSVDDAETGANVVSVDDAETGANVVSGDVAETVDNVKSDILMGFVGLIERCFSDNTKTFSGLAAQNNNKDAFNIGHEVLSQVCKNDVKCIRNAYCVNANSLKSVNKYLDKNIGELNCKNTK